MSSGPDTQLFREVFNASPIGIAIENLDGQPLFVNPAFCAMLGFSAEELRNKHCADFSPPQDAEKDWALFQQLRAGSIDHYQLEKRYFRSDGSLVWGRLSVSVLTRAPSPLVLAMVEDISEKKAAEGARFKHAAIIESSEDAIIANDLDGVITSWNAGAERMFKYTESEVVGQSITILIPSERQKEENKILDRLRSGARIEHYETKRVTKAGKNVDVSLTIGPIKDASGKVVGFTRITHDITQRKQAEEGLRGLNRALAEQARLLQSQDELLNIFVQNVPAGVAMLDRDMRYLQVSDRWCADYAAERSQLLGRSLYEVFPDLPARWKEIHRRALEGETLRAEEDGWVRPGGTKWLHWEIRPWKTATGVVGGILIFAEDITRRKQMEEALSGVSRKLIESQEQERTRIARELHDDINQQLALLAVELHRLGQEAPPGASAKFHTHLQQAVERITNISQDVQNLSHRLHSSKLEYLGLARAAKSFCKELSEQGNVEIAFHSAGSLMGVPYDVSLCVFRVLQEALQNAIKHSRVRSFEVELRGTKNSVELTVVDHGVGFEQQDPANYSGLGLLSMRERALLVKGELSIKSAVGAGTAIRLFVPLAYSARDQRLAG